MNELINEYLTHIIRANEKINLTNIKDENQAKLLHIEDSLAVLNELNSAPEGLYGDLGSGGGFPGVPLAIASGRRTVLIDSVKKKMLCVEDILKELDLTEQIQTCSLRIEELALTSPESFSVLTARALSNLSSLIELASPLLKHNGQLICLKARIEEPEINNAVQIEDKTGMKLISRRSYMLSDNDIYREVLVFEKVSEPTVKLPRRIGMAQKKPLTD